MQADTLISDSDLQVGHLVEHHLEATAQMLASTFDDDAAYRYLFPRQHARTRGLADFFTRNLRTHLPHRCTYVAYERTGEPLATVTVRPPQGVPISMLTMLRRGLLPFALAHGRSGVQRLLWLKDTYDALEQRVARAAPHWHVHMMAVRRDRQGQGVGSALLRHVLAQTADTTEHVTVLTTHSPENVAFYRRAGFDLLAEQQLEPPGARAYTVWSMHRIRSAAS
jgi:ribosomal protein S18 acetylase RimI-like enzyme